MTKRSGLGARFFLGGHNLSGDVNSFSLRGGPAPWDVTDITQLANAREGLLRDGGIDWVSYFNPESIAGGDAEDRAHVVLSSLPTTDRTETLCIGTTLGDPSACVVAKQLNYDPTRGQDGSLTVAVQSQASGFGLQWGRQATAGIRTDTAATNGGCIDEGAATDFGLAAFLHVFSITGTDATIKIQESSDNGAGDAFADVTGGTFTEITAAPTAERIVTALDLTVERYLRVVTTTSAGFSDLQFAVTICRNYTETKF
jgi:hypothetical protein